MNRALLQDAAAALAGYRREMNDTQPCDTEMALRAELAKPERQPMTDEQIDSIEFDIDFSTSCVADLAIALRKFAREIERHHGIGNKPCPYCSSDNPGIRDTYFDQTCKGCCERMKP